MLWCFFSFNIFIKDTIINGEKNNKHIEMLLDFPWGLHFFMRNILFIFNCWIFTQVGNLRYYYLFYVFQLLILFMFGLIDYVWISNTETINNEKFKRTSGYINLITILSFVFYVLHLVFTFPW
jgi:hypothetical protein